MHSDVVCLVFILHEVSVERLLRLKIPCYRSVRIQGDVVMELVINYVICFYALYTKGMQT